MKSDQQKNRRMEIEEAAYRVLSERGYKSATLPVIAKAAKTSNETLYRWYGGKAGLFAALVESNADRVRTAIVETASADQDPIKILGSAGLSLLTMLTSERAIALNRAAATDASESGTLGELLGRHGREAVLPILKPVVEEVLSSGGAPEVDGEEALATYLHLLIGDIQVRLVTGAMASISAEQIDQRSQRALAQFLKLYIPEGR